MNKQKADKIIVEYLPKIYGLLDKYKNEKNF